ncbi:MAG: DUF1461 domain-containing protein [Coriobacteriales bacterium]|jgi:integral membrane protein (TIGR01906 family)|nr:DUF1461 domain-containing protein [Coriobacteriales bacterium]
MVGSADLEANLGTEDKTKEIDGRVIIQGKPLSKLFKFLTVLFTIFLAVWLVSITFTILKAPFMTAFWAERTVDAEASPLSKDELVDNALVGLAFVAGDRNAVMPVGDDETISYPPDVVSHMQDVRTVFEGLRIFTLFTSLILIFLFVLLVYRRAYRQLGTALLVGGISTFILCLVVAAIGYLNFDALFAWLHSLFFAEGSWTFSADSLLICTYPLQFWIDMGASWAIMLATACLLSVVAGIILRIKRRKTSSARTLFSAPFSP